MSAAVQKDPPEMNRAATHGCSWGVASTPLMMRAGLGIPQPGTANQIMKFNISAFRDQYKLIVFTNRDGTCSGLGLTCGSVPPPCVECDEERTDQPISLEF